MRIDEKNIEVVIDALVTKIRDLELGVLWRDSEIEKLKTELENKKGADNETV